MPTVAPAVEDGDVLGDRDAMGCVVERAEVDVGAAAVVVAELVERNREVGAQLDERHDLAPQRADALDGDAARRLSCVRGSWPSAPSRSGPAKSTTLRAASAARSRGARLVVDQLPGRVGDRRVRAKQVVHRDAPFRLPIPSEPAGSSWRRPRLRLPDSASAASPCSTMSPGWKSTPSRDLAPARRPPQQELEIHAEVLELLALRVVHDRGGLGVGLDREPLLVPADRLGLLGQRRAEARERSRRRRELVGWLVVLVESHRTSLNWTTETYVCEWVWTNGTVGGSGPWTLMPVPAPAGAAARRRTGRARAH